MLIEPPSRDKPPSAAPSYLYGSKVYSVYIGIEHHTGSVYRVDFTLAYSIFFINHIA